MKGTHPVRARMRAAKNRSYNHFEKGFSCDLTARLVQLSAAFPMPLFPSAA